MCCMYFIGRIVLVWGCFGLEGLVCVVGVLWLGFFFRYRFSLLEWVSVEVVIIILY